MRKAARHGDRRTTIGAGKIHLSRGIEKRWSIFHCTIREVQGPVWPRAARQIIVGSPRSMCEVQEHFFFILRDRDLDKNI